MAGSNKICRDNHIHYTSLHLLFLIIMHLLMLTCLCYHSGSVLDLHVGENVPYGSGQLALIQSHFCTPCIYLLKKQAWRCIVDVIIPTNLVWACYPYFINFIHTSFCFFFFYCSQCTLSTSSYMVWLFNSQWSDGRCRSSHVRAKFVATPLTFLYLTLVAWPYEWDFSLGRKF